MSLFGSLFTGVSALTAQSSNISSISNNISNVNTTGYKRTSSNFSSLVAGNGSATSFAPGGVRSTPKQTISEQGLLEQTGSRTDLGVSGNGYFIVRDEAVAGNAETFYTRAGSFNVDADGFLQNGSGYYLMGWPVDVTTGVVQSGASGLSDLVPVTVSSPPVPAVATTTASIAANLDATQNTAVAGPHFQREIEVFDSLGTSRRLNLAFTKQVAANTWNLDITDPDGAFVLATQTLTFNGNGTLATPVGGTIAVTPITWTAAPLGANVSTVTLDVSNVTQFSERYAVSGTDQNGSSTGTRTTVAIDEDGFVTATYTNGARRQLFQIPLAEFPNPNALDQRSGTALVETASSGRVFINAPNVGTAGQTISGTLEGSNVDLGNEFSRLIVTQRAYSAGTKIITTVDQLLVELLQLR